MVRAFSCTLVWPQPSGLGAVEGDGPLARPASLAPSPASETGAGTAIEALGVTLRQVWHSRPASQRVPQRARLYSTLLRLGAGVISYQMRGNRGPVAQVPFCTRCLSRR